MSDTFLQRAQATRQLERWTQVYREQPELFRLFEKAEDPEGLAARALAERADLAGRRVLEIGCGTGWLTRHVAHLAGEYVAVEPSSRMLEQAGSLTPARVVRARGECLPFPSGSFDRIVMSWVFLDLRPAVRRRVLEECARVIQPLEGSGGDPSRGVWLIENGATGEFQGLRDLVDVQGFGEVTPLIEDLGFVQLESVATHMRFQSEREAGAVLGAILGIRAAVILADEPRIQLGMDLSVLFRSM